MSKLLHGTFIIAQLLFLLAFVRPVEIIHSEEIHVQDLSRAYYGDLAGSEHLYHIDGDFPLQLALFSKNTRAYVYKEQTLIKVIQAQGFPKWKFNSEEVPAGKYTIIVRPIQRITEQEEKYMLNFGFKSQFALKERMRSIVLIPSIYKSFSSSSYAGLLKTSLGWVYILFFCSLGWGFGLIYRAIAGTLFQKRSKQRNIGSGGRLLRLFIALFLFTISILTNWSSLFLFFSGFTLYEAIFSWCGFYALIGKSICSV